MTSAGDLLALADLTATIQGELKNHVFLFLTRPVCACGVDLGEISEPPTMDDQAMLEAHRIQVAIRVVSDRMADDIDQLVIAARTDQRPGAAMATGRDMASRRARRYAEAVRSRE